MVFPITTRYGGRKCQVALHEQSLGMKGMSQNSPRIRIAIYLLNMMGIEIIGVPVPDRINRYLETHISQAFRMAKADAAAQYVRHARANGKRCVFRLPGLFFWSHMQDFFSVSDLFIFFVSISYEE